MPITQERMVAILTEAESLFIQHEDLRAELIERISVQYQQPQPISEFLSELVLIIERSKAEAGKAMLIERYHFDKTWKKNEKLKLIQLQRRRERGIQEPKHNQRRPQLGQHLYPAAGLSKVEAALTLAKKLQEDSDPDAMQVDVWVKPSPAPETTKASPLDIEEYEKFNTGAADAAKI